jgi:hypothetical protein
MEGHMAKTPAFKIPKKLGAVTDLLVATRDARLALAKQVEELQARETALKDYIINNVPKDSAGAKGAAYTAKPVTKTKPRVTDWDKFYEYVRRNKAFDLLQRRLGENAVAERWADKKVVPGVESFNYVDVSIIKNT